LAVAFNVIAGFNDGGNLLAAAASGRIIPLGVAFWVIVAGAFVGPLIVGTAVAATIGHSIVDYAQAGFTPLAGGLVGGIGAVLVAYAARLPTTASVALVGATLGSVWVTGQMRLVQWAGVAKVAYSLFGSAIVGFAAGAIIYTLACFLFAHVSLRQGMRLMRLQYVTVLLQAIGYGANDAEKMMGLIAAAVLIRGAGGGFAVPVWIVAVSIGAFALGMAVGGMRVARTVGGKLFHIHPLHALCFQLAAAGTVLGASSLGGPLSTTEVTASAIMGVGAAANPRALRWRTARNLAAAWLLTAPLGFACGALATFVIRLIERG
jgi:PiT family inorganic phosphate transporter